MDAGGALVTDLTLMEVGRAALPYRLTGSQERVLQQILEDMQAPLPMLRLLQASASFPTPPPPPLSQHAFPSCGVWHLKTARCVGPVIQAVRKSHQSVLGFGSQLLSYQGRHIMRGDPVGSCVSSVMRHDMQGDVGCGKTVIAFLALLAAAGSGFQGAMMAPTEVGCCHAVTQADPPPTLAQCSSLQRSGAFVALNCLVLC